MNRIKSRINSKWKRFYLKIVREKATPEYIARGWSIGMFFGLVIPIGGQLLFSIPVSFLLKGSKIGAVLGTLLTNHVTIFFIYPIQCYVGSLLLGTDSPYSVISVKIHDLVEEPTFQSLWNLFQNGGGIVESFFAGGLFFAAIFTPMTYFLVCRTVKQHRIHLEKKKQKRLKNREEKQC